MTQADFQLNEEQLLQVQTIETKISTYKHLAQTEHIRLKNLQDQYGRLKNDLVFHFKIDSMKQQLQPSLQFLAILKTNASDYPRVQVELKKVQQEKLELSTKHSILQKNHFINQIQNNKKNQNLYTINSLLQKKIKQYKSLNFNKLKFNHEIAKLSEFLNGIEKHKDDSLNFQEEFIKEQKAIKISLYESSSILKPHEEEQNLLLTEDISPSINTSKKNNHPKKRRWFQMGWNLWNDSKEEEYLDTIESLKNRNKDLSEGINQYEALLQKVHTYLQNREQIEQGTSKDIKKILENLEGFIRREEDLTSKLSSIEAELKKVKADNQNLQSHKTELNRIIQMLESKEENYKSQITRLNKQNSQQKKKRQNQMKNEQQMERNPNEHFQKMLGKTREQNSNIRNQRPSPNLNQKKTTSAKDAYPFQNVKGATVFNPLKYSQNPYK
ncbi:hypothetical protein FZC79_07890 [Rossellomorea vietnamensis]|uniref:Uncharacterized protein n=1 Tax=Rossellomorea vietnamensis TaxID=218284 RepID=A0A5D4KH69_9BACI|nr:hypothetical protein [Rossellomorea vietnamensis]TYR76065.1 hypothetical protein FZC79_07890 [Rossellomorea vietnamensis]